MFILRSKEWQPTALKKKKKKICDHDSTNVTFGEIIVRNCTQGVVFSPLQIEL